MRKTHRMLINHEQSTPSRVLYLDSEATITTEPNETQHQRLAFGWALYRRNRTSWGKPHQTERWHRFDTSDSAWETIERYAHVGERLYVYAHNWDYDAAMIELDTQATARGWVCKKWGRSTHFLFAQLKKGSATIMLVDTLNYWAGSLKSLSAYVGLPKLEFPDDMTDTATADAYCQRDVEILAAFMETLFALASQQKWGRFPPTLPGLAFSAFRHRYMTKRPLIIADDAVCAFERLGYHGGRTECFHIGRVDKPLVQFDVNSMYPAVMKDELYPLEKIRQGQSLTLDEYRRFRRRFLVCAECELSTPEPAYAVTLGKKLVFPIGEFSTVLSTPEIDYALENGHLRAINRYMLYVPALLFQAYVTDIYALRLRYKSEGNKPFELLCKLMLNALYGKFGQAGRTWEKCAEPYDNPPYAFDYDCLRQGEPLPHVRRWGDVWHQLRGAESFESFPAIAAHVTAYARITLWRYIQTAGRDHVYYCDTDSLFVDEQGAANLAADVSPTELGKLKEVERYEWCEFRAPKDYTTDKYARTKGIRPRALLLPDGSYKQDQFRSYHAMLNKGIEGEIIVAPIIKHLTRHYDKGTIDPSGRVAPFILPRG